MKPCEPVLPAATREIVAKEIRRTLQTRQAELMAIVAAALASALGNGRLARPPR
jgi:hypothetical protein